MPVSGSRAAGFGLSVARSRNINIIAKEVGNACRQLLRVAPPTTSQFLKQSRARLKSVVIRQKRGSIWYRIRMHVIRFTLGGTGWGKRGVITVHDPSD